MTDTSKRAVLKRIVAVRKIVAEEIANNARGGGTGAGLSNEGFAGGYIAALDDIDAALRHGSPSDHRGYWRRASNKD